MLSFVVITLLSRYDIMSSSMYSTDIIDNCIVSVEEYVIVITPVSESLSIILIVYIQLILSTPLSSMLFHLVSAPIHMSYVRVLISHWFFHSSIYYWSFVWWSNNTICPCHYSIWNSHCVSLRCHLVVSMSVRYSAVASSSLRMGSLYRVTECRCARIRIHHRLVKGWSGYVPWC